MEEKIKKQIRLLSSSKNRRKVMRYFYTFSKSHNTVYPSQTRIAEKTGINNQSNVSAIIKELINAGLIVLIKKGRFSPNIERMRNNQYFVPDLDKTVLALINDYKEEITGDEEVRENLDEVLENNEVIANNNLIAYVESMKGKIPANCYEILKMWVTKPLYNGHLMSDDVDRFRLKLNDFVKEYCMYVDVDGKSQTDWEKFYNHVKRAFKVGGVKLVKEGDLTAQKERAITKGTGICL